MLLFSARALFFCLGTFSLVSSQSTPQIVSAFTSVFGGQTISIFYSPTDNTPTTFVLRKGSPSNLVTVDTLTTSATGGKFAWTVSKTLPTSNDYVLEIRRGSVNNFSGQFSITQASSNAESSAALSSAPSPIRSSTPAPAPVSTPTPSLASTPTPTPTPTLVSSSRVVTSSTLATSGIASQKSATIAVNPTDTAALVSILNAIVPSTAQTNAQAACFLASTISNGAYTIPGWYTSLPAAAQSYFTSINTNFASCTAAPNNSGSASQFSSGEKAGIAIGSIAGAAAVAGAVAFALIKFGIIGSGAAALGAASTGAGASTAAGVSGAGAQASMTQPPWDGRVNPGWNGVVGHGGGPPVAPHGGNSNTLWAAGAIRQNREQHNSPTREYSHNQFPIQAYNSQAHEGLEIKEDAYPGMEVSSVQYPHVPLPRPYSRTTSSGDWSLPSPQSARGQGYGTDVRSNTYTGSNVSELRGDQFAYQAELGGNPRAEMGMNTPARYP